ncbi:hypothetical protein SAMN04487931_101353 [Desulfobacula phenolica]|uniref:Uncharacterized protein n=2 Tax=Desulfobacula phenolica TaxID=90732 RepID=A0A1H2DPN8_9BACT|nr:hypothetical protein SAMN04487931_101353 [Desulfobacula phenolica]
MSVHAKRELLATVKSWKLLKHQIPIRTFADWEDEEPGFFEADLVAHCGWSMEGSFLYTLVLTDVSTGWVECIALLQRVKANALEKGDYEIILFEIRDKKKTLLFKCVIPFQGTCPVNLKSSCAIASPMPAGVFLK